jgi:hypothetical protein
MPDPVRQNPPQKSETVRVFHRVMHAWFEAHAKARSRKDFGFDLCVFATLREFLFGCGRRPRSTNLEITVPMVL